jgi:D-alanyl-D-alanine carboxypeptidase
MKQRSYLLLATPFLIVFVVACVCSGSGTTPTIVSTAAPDQPTTAADQPTAAVEPTSAPAQATTYNVGDVVQVKDQTIVMNSAEISNGILKANFTVENTGATNLTVSSVLSFTVKDNDGTKLEQDIFDCGGSGLDGDVLVGDKLRGDICWKVTTASPFKIYYQAELFDSASTVVWVVSQ